jgi:hypothetical protein
VRHSVAADGSRLLEGIPWDKGVPERVNPEIIQLLIAASLVESRGDAYGEYLARVFSDEPDFVESIHAWSQEENEHGIALGTWLSRSLPYFDFPALLSKYNESITLAYSNSADTASIRGSKAGELLSRCAVESATSTYYKAVASAVDDLPLNIICSRLSQDEISHYSLFRRKLDKIRETESISPFTLMRMSLSRLFELEDDQMSFAFYIAANTNGPYERRYYSSLMTRTAYRLYSKSDISDLVKLNLRAFGLSKSAGIRLFGHARVVNWISRALYLFMKSKMVFLNLRIRHLDSQRNFSKVHGAAR